MGAQRRSTQSNPLHVGAAKPTGGQCPRMNAGAKEPRALARGRTPGRDLWFLWAGPALRRLPKGLAVRAKPPAAVTADTDMYTIQNSSRLKQSLREQARSHKGLGTSARVRLAVKPPSRASPLPQGTAYIRQNQVGCQARSHKSCVVIRQALRPASSAGAPRRPVCPAGTWRGSCRSRPS